MIKVVLIGAGNVAIHLAKALQESKDIDLIQRYSRSNHNIDYFDNSIPVTHHIESIKTADIVIISILDDAVSDFSKRLKFKEGLVVHTSGNLSFEKLKCRSNRGVFYPLQSFSKDRILNFKNIPLCLETEKSSDYLILEKLGSSLSNSIYKIDFQQRKFVHLAAVFANNFTNHMYKISQDICKKQQIPFELLKPLIEETAKKISMLDPIIAQTGPAKRKDQKVIKNHLQYLNKNQQEIYKLVTDSIIKTYQSS